MRFEALLGSRDLLRVVENKYRLLPDQAPNWRLLTAKLKKAYLKKVKARKVAHAVTWSLLLEVCNPTHLSLVSPYKKEKDCVSAWRAILRYFGEDSSPVAQFNAMGSFMNLKMDTDESVDVELRFQNFVADIETESAKLGGLQGVAVPDSQKVYVLMRGMPTQFHELNKVLLTNLGETFEFPKACEAVRHSLQQDRIHRRGQDSVQQPPSKKARFSAPPSASGPATESSLDSIANFAAKFDKKFSNLSKKLFGRQKKFDKSGKGHDKGGGKGGGGDGKKSKEKLCFICNKPGHFARECSQRPQSQGTADAAMEQSDLDLLNANGAVLDAFMANDALVVVDSFDVVETAYNVSDNLMVMDSGASRSHVNTKCDLAAFDSGRGTEVKTANGHVIRSTGSGRLGEMTNVFHTPEFKNSLLSISQLADMGFTTSFKKDCAEVRCAITGALKATGKRIGNLYVLDTATVKSLKALDLSACAVTVGDCLLASTKPSSTLDALHSRTHLSDELLRTLSDKNMVEGLKLSKSEFYRNPSVCSVCAVCKMSRRSFKKSSHRPIPANNFELVYTDVEGPIKPVGRDGIRYIVVFACARSRYRTVYFMKTKDEATSMFEHFKSQCVDAYGFKISEVVSDGGGEYIGEFYDFCVDNGIVSLNTSPHTPEENNAEQYWRTLMGMTRAFLKTSSLPYNMWPWAAKHANYVLNRTLAVELDGVTKTPFEWRFNVKPNLANLRVWGCECFYKVHGHVLKLDDRGKEGFYLGLDNNSRSAIIYDKSSGKLYKSGHVVYNEIIRRREEVDSAVPGEAELTSVLGSVHENFGSGSSFGVALSDFNEEDSDDEGEIVRDRSNPNSFTVTARRQYLNLESDSEDDGESSDIEEVLTKRKRGRPPGSRNIARSSPSGAPRRSARLSGGQANSAETDGDLYEPEDFDDAMDCEQGAQWKVSADDELGALDVNNTWKLWLLPPGRKALKTKWVFKVKRDENGRPVKKKSRLTIKGYVQRHGVDYWETFSPVAKLISVRLFFSLVAQLDLNIFQLDVNNAFLNADLKEEIYMEVPKGFDLDSAINSLPSDHELRGVERSRVCLKLNKALYGLKQAPREWYLNVSSFLKSIGFVALGSDSCIFVRRDGEEFSMIALYVDDMVVASSDKNKMADIVRQFNQRYQMKNIGEVKQLLGMNVQRDRRLGTLKLSQKKYIDELLVKFKMDGAQLKPTPMDKDAKLSKTQCPETDEDKAAMAKVPYRELIGSLMYLSVGTRPDISFAVSELSKFLMNPGMAHWLAAKHVLRYLKGTSTMGITYRRDAGGGGTGVRLTAYSNKQYRGPSKTELGKLEAYSDADWGGDKDTRRSHTGAVLFLAGGAIAWISKKQSSVAMSSAEAEYMAASLTCREVIWVRAMLAGLGFKQREPTTIFEDNSACIQMSKNPVLHSRTKHIDLHYHFVRERTESAEVKLEWVPTDEMVADMMTKALTTSVFETLREKLFGV